MIQDLLAKDVKISNVEIIKDEITDEETNTRRVFGRFVRDKMVYSFLNARTNKFNYISIRFQFIYTLKTKKVIRNEILELVNSANKSIPAVKIYLNDINGKSIKINFNVEIPYVREETLNFLVPSAIDVVSFAPFLFSSKLESKGFEHQTIS
ncbi:hypothetical protein [Kosakonia oryzae]|uniref:Uncharacterized protein n=1 Tax=Kosakonia oryzae TaxID=497725 RepID=A0AA94KNY7_9ENTR|nr:hypothetical protein [Kosakonia oryzae]ANI83954.1 hypothetical protein AWR26_18040 [Kosakonia oryzae]SFB74415.1 hypothetical protein SAMN05216286_0620 [Kosakonia oryzae]